MSTKDPYYCECGERATWLRHTQFAGTQAFCTTHTLEEDNFKGYDPSYFCWEKLPDQEACCEAPTEDEEPLDGWRLAGMCIIIASSVFVIWLLAKIFL